MGHSNAMRLIGLLFVAFTLSGCAGFVTQRVGGGVADSLTTGIMQQNDLELVKAGLPSYMLLLDGMIAENPESPELALAAAQLYSAYAGLFASENPERAKNLSAKALTYAQQGACMADEAFCDFANLRHRERLPIVEASDDINMLYTLGSIWAGYIQHHQSDWAAVAQLATVTKLIEHTVALDETYKNGEPYMYLGVLYTLVPPAAGGQPERGQQAFDKAVHLSNHSNLMAKVLYAKHYARLMFDENLHNRLLNSVLRNDVSNPDYTLLNTLAKQEAAQLLESGKDFF